MFGREFTTEKLTDMWEDRRAVKNLMGKFAYCFLIKKEYTIFDLYWSKKETDISLAVNDGYYIGRNDVKKYFDAIDESLKVKRDVLKSLFPDKVSGKTDEELYGIGELEYVALSTPVVEVATNDNTARGIWYCHGSSAEVGTCGPVAYWTWKCYAVDFVKEDGEWKIWHMIIAEDVKHPCGQNWAKPAEGYPDLNEFEALRECLVPEPTIKKTIREHYYPSRAFSPLPEPPEPYDVFQNTSSYGYCDE